MPHDFYLGSEDPRYDFYLRYSGIEVLKIIVYNVLCNSDLFGVCCDSYFWGFSTIYTDTGLGIMSVLN